MNCDFIKSLTPEQRKDLRERLDECEVTESPKYSVKYELWENGKIESLREYSGDQLHGFSLGWHKNGQPHWKAEYQNGQLHGLSFGWYSDGQQALKREYQNELEHGVALSWHEDGRQRYKEEWQHGLLIKREDK